MAGIRVQVMQACFLSISCEQVLCYSRLRILCGFSLQAGQILIIDPVTAVLNLMTAFGLLAVASLVRCFVPINRTSLRCPRFRLCLSSSKRSALCFRQHCGSVESSTFSRGFLAITAFAFKFHVWPSSRMFRACSVMGSHVNWTKVKRTAVKIIATKKSDSGTHNQPAQQPPHQSGL
jgi:hypothetical protein